MGLAPDSVGRTGGYREANLRLRYVYFVYGVSFRSSLFESVVSLLLIGRLTTVTECCGGPRVGGEQWMDGDEWME